jgi:hypothetical protein
METTKYEGTVFADGKLVTNKWFDDFLRFHRNSRTLQLDCVLGTDPYDGKVGDWLMENTFLYDTVDTKYMDASNIVQDVFEGNNNPKKRWGVPKFKELQKKVGIKEDYQTVLDGFDDKKKKWKRVDYIYALIVHRITGSASSYLPHDHGYRNTIVPFFHKCNDIHEMTQVIRNLELVNTPMYTSGACQIPGFPKAHREDLYGEDINKWKQGTLFLCHVAPRLARDLDKLMTSAEKKGNLLTHHQVLKFMTDWNWNQKIKRFHFQYHLISVDLSDQWPHIVDPHSLSHWGSASSRAMDLLTDRVEGKKISKTEKIHATSALVNEIIGPNDSRHKWNESVACNYDKYFMRWIPECPEYAHLLVHHPSKLTLAEALACDEPGATWDPTSDEEIEG